MLSIRVKILLIITSIVLGITVSGMVLSLSISQGSFWETLQSDLTASAELASRMVSGEIEVLKRDVQIIGTQLNFIGETETTERLQYYTIHGPYLSLAVFDSQGWVYFYGRAAPPNSYLENEHLKRAFSGETCVSPPEWESGGNLVMRIWTPLEDGRVLIATIPGLSLSRMVSDFRLWETGNIFIVDHEGYVIANIREYWVSERYNFILRAEADKQFASPAKIVSRMITGETGLGYYTIGGVDRIAAFRPVSGSDGWSLGVVAPIAETPVSGIRRMLFLSSAVFLGLGLIAAIFAANSVAIPFKKIEEQNIHLGELRASADNANEAKSRFLANVSHEMRTPLNAIIGLSELELGVGELDGEMYDNTEKIYNSGITLLGIINDLLDISKIESGKFELIPVEYDVPSLVNDTVSLNAVRIGSKPVKFRLHVDENIPAKLFGDELRIKQIFNNLLSNAIKYTREGAVDWYLSTQKDGNKVWLQSRIEDTGIGIKEEDIPKLFSEYGQVDTKSNRKIEGTGLGLAISRSMVQLMNGDIKVESEYGKGSVFTVRILQEPIGVEVVGKETAENLNRFSYTLQRRTRNQKLIRAWIPYASVLVVDDVSTNLDVTRGMLKPYGMTVDCVTSGPAAIGRIREGKPVYNAVFMDHMMPGMDGIEATRIIREDIGTDYAKNIPVIALTADAIIGNEKLFLDGGFQAFLTKPIDIMLLDSVITRWVRNKELEKELKEKSPELFTRKSGSNNARFQDKKDSTAAHPGSGRSISLMEAAKGIAGFDITMGLELMGNDIESWLEVMRSFVSHTPELLDSLHDVKAENLPEYTVTVHGIKGSCYSLGAQTVGKKAEDLEHRGRAGDMEFVKENTPDFITQAEKLVNDFNILIRIAEEENSKALMPAPDRDLLVKILNAAKNYNMGELEEFITGLEQYRYEQDNDLVPWLRGQSNRSEFLAIQERLAKMLK